MRNQKITRWLVLAVFTVLVGCNKSATSANSSVTSASNSTPAAAQSAQAPAQEPAPAPPPPVVIPEGTVLTVTIDESVGTKTNNDGDRFDASLAAPLTVDGNEVLPAGTKAIGTVVQAKSAGRVKGGAILQLTLDSIKLNGTDYPIETSSFEETGKGRGKRTATGAGGGAAFGGILGAIAGGGRGAGIGLLVGGAAGTAGAAFTGKRDFTIPAETRLHFKLRNDVAIQQ